MVHTIHQIVEEVRDALESRLRVRGRTLALQVRRAGRRLPRSVRRDAIFLVRSGDLAENPKLIPMINMQQARRARKNILAFLETVDVAAARRAMALQIVASIAFVILVTAVILLFVLVQRGFV